jgi:hypothetical protein
MHDSRTFHKSGVRSEWPGVLLLFLVGAIPVTEDHLLRHDFFECWIFEHTVETAANRRHDILVTCLFTDLSTVSVDENGIPGCNSVRKNVMGSR